MQGIAGANRKPNRITSSIPGRKRSIEIAPLENAARRIGALLLIVMLGSLFLGLARASRRPRGRVSGAATAVLRPRIYILILVPYTGVCILLWRPFVQTLSTSARFVALFVGSFCYGVGIALVLWGRTTLGDMYNASSTLGAQLFEKHRLITRGPYQYVRHPIYLGMVLAATRHLENAIPENRRCSRLENHRRRRRPGRDSFRGGERCKLPTAFSARNFRVRM